jgi:hypothetical protein
MNEDKIKELIDKIDNVCGQDQYIIIIKLKKEIDNKEDEMN